MKTFEIMLLIISVFSLFITLAMFIIFSKKIDRLSREKTSVEAFNEELQRQMGNNRQEINESVQNSVTSLGTSILNTQERTAQLEDKRIAELISQLVSRQELLQSSLNERLTQLDRRFVSFQSQSEEKLENIRNSVEVKLNSIQESNSKKLDEMRATVDEKLQKTLNERLAQSFSQVSDRLEQVYKGLGEMQTLAIGVGDLKKVLSNVKTRGILGEIQLGAILEQILSPEQYAVNVATKKGSTAVVEFAVKLPGDGNEPVYLPIDSKFPGDRYQSLMDAYDCGDKDAVVAASKELERALKLSAKDIHDKYIDTPYTTDFGIMFLPFEGLYAEAIRMGMVEILSRDYKINIAGPTTMAALLNSLQMGFKTLAIQRRSGEVWEILGAVKTEFAKFSDILETARTKLRRANDDLDVLIGTRTRAIQRKLKEVTQLTSDDSLRLLEITDDIEGDSDDN